MLAPVVPADVHQLDRVERALSAPRRPGGVRGLAAERVLDRHEAGARPVAPRHRQLVRDVREQRDVDILEEAVPDEVRLGAEELFGGPRPDPDRPGKLLPLHDLLHRDRRGDVDRLSRVVSLAVSRPAFDQRVAVGDAGLLRRLRDAVDVGAERNHRLAGSPARHERGRDAGDPLFDREPVLLQEVDQIAVRLLLLKAELTVAEDLIDHLLRERRHAVDGAGHLALQTIDARIDLHGRPAQASPPPAPAAPQRPNRPPSEPPEPDVLPYSSS